jgi:hypothetical protein
MEPEEIKAEEEVTNVVLGICGGIRGVYMGGFKFAKKHDSPRFGERSYSTVRTIIKI